MRLVALALVFAAIVPGATREPVHARHAMVVSAEPHATRVGVEVLQDGGNAVDAAVAVGLTLAVTHPSAGNIGGGGFMLIRLADGRSTFIDFRERAPGKATRDMYVGPDGETTDESIVGYKASGIPGTVRGLALARQKYGSKPWRSLVEPAQRLAERGFPIPYGLARAMRDSTRMAKVPESVRIFQNGGRFFEYGDTLRRRDLAKTLKRIGKRGPDEFYAGETARLIAAEMAQNGGLITLDDLRGYEATEREPLRGTYRGREILTAPPPSSGGAGIIQMLNMLEPTEYFKAGAESAAAIHAVTEAMRRYFADRAAYFGDTDFVKMPLEKLLDKQYATAALLHLRP